MLSGRQKSNLKTALPVFIIFLAAVWVVSPVLKQPTAVLPIRSNNLITVPLFNAWTFWWNADRLQHGFVGYWEAPIFAPETHAFAFSEPQPASVIVAPIIWLSGSPALGYNVYLFLSLFLNGLVTFAVLRRHRFCRSQATVGAIMMVWLPLNLRQIEVLQLVPIWPLLWTWDALRRHGRAPGCWTAVELACAYSVSFYTCIHHTLFLSIVLLATGWILFAAFRQRRFWSNSLMTLILAGFFVGIIFWPMRQALKRDSFQRSQELVTRLSVSPPDLILPPKDALLLGSNRVNLGMSPGWLKVLLAVTGICLGLCRRRRKRWVTFLSATVIVAGLLALGPNLKVGNFQPWWFISEWIPGMSQVRNVFRFTYLMQLGIILLAMVGLREILIRMRRCCRARTAYISIVLMTIPLFVEVPAPRPTLGGVPDLSRHHGWTEFVRTHTPAGKALICLPVSPGVAAADFDVTVRWMYYGTLHGIPLINGYSGFFPEEYLQLREDLTETGLTDATLTRLVAMNAHFIVTQRDYAIPGSGGENRLQRFGLRHVFEDATASINVYEIVETTAAH